MNAGTPALRVTLEGDGPGGNHALAATDAKVINDLDLTLGAPGGAIQYPWQLDQMILDSALSPMSDAAQARGTPLNVQRAFVPVADPKFDPVTRETTATTRSRPAGCPSRAEDTITSTPSRASTWPDRPVGFGARRRIRMHRPGGTAALLPARHHAGAARHRPGLDLLVPQ